MMSLVVKRPRAYTSLTNRNVTGAPNRASHLSHRIDRRTQSSLEDHLRQNRCIIQGERVTDAETLSQMDIPDYESCVHVAKSAVAALVGA